MGLSGVVSADSTTGATMDQCFFTRQAELKNGFGLRYQVPRGAAEAELSAFVIKFEDRLHAYENRCPHLGIELDWVPGQFFDDEQALLVCSTHGARFKPDTGQCVSGPCVGQSLTRLDPVISEE